MGYFLVLLLSLIGQSIALNTRNTATVAVNGVKMPKGAIARSGFKLSMGAPDEAPFKNFVCPSCSYVYSEEKGSRPKSRYPPGTRWNDIEVFLCPVCGASKNQFVEYNEDEGLPPVPETIN